MIPKKKFLKKKITLVVLNLFSLPLVMPLAVLRYVFKVKFWRMRGSRIGHLAGNTEFLLRKIQSGTEKELNHVAIASSDIANQQLLAMFRRKLKVVTFPQPIYLRALLRILALHSILKKTKLFQELPPAGPPCEFTATKPSLTFTEQEEGQGKELLQKLSVGDNWFICFHSRDPSYLDGQWKKGDSYHGFRNSDVNNFLKAAEYITQQGGYAFRMGAKVDKALSVENPRIIDYAALHRDDFGDIYLTGKCKFFLGTTAGLVCVAFILHKPIAFTNLIPVNTPALGEKDLFIPKKIWSQKEERFLTLREILHSEVIKYGKSEEYHQAGLVPMENTAEEILDLAREMNQRLDGTWRSADGDEKLQKKFRLILEENLQVYQFPARIGAQFLRENKDLLK